MGLIGPLFIAMIVSFGLTLSAIAAPTGVLRIGVKRDVPLWGEFNGHELVGFEPDLARDLGRSLGRKVKLVGLNTAERVEALTQGRVDVLIATLSDTPQRRQLLHLVMPHYYSSGANVLVDRSDHVRRWDDLKQRRVCARQGAFYNRQLMVEFGLDLVPLFDNRLTQHSMLLGRCDAWLHDDSALLAILREPEWASRFEMPLPSRLHTPWAIALRPADAQSELARQISHTVVRWHQNGFLIDLEKRWGIPPSEFVQHMHQLWRPPPNQPATCQWPIHSSTPATCL
jgi:polar amino acid transport system substrate-binding protein